MTLKARIYIAVVLAAGAAALVHGFSQWQPQNLVRFACYLVLAVPASCLKVRLPGVTGTMSVLFVFLLAGIVDLTLAETLLLGAVCVVVQSFWHAKVRPRVVQLFFSVANIAFAIWWSHWAYHSVASLVPFIDAPFRLAVSASVFFVTNTLPVAIVIALTERKSLRQVWSHCYFWSFSYYLVGAAIVAVFSFAHRTFGWQVSLLVLPVVYVIYRSYRLYLGQLETEREQADTERQHAQEVASLQARTMDALASAMAANAKLDAVIQASPLAILALDENRNVTSWNTMAERVLGWSPEESIGRALPLSEGRSADFMQDIVNRTFSGDVIAGVEGTQWRKDGSPFEAAIWTAPLRDGGGRVSGILITVADVSERRRLEDQLRLSQKMEAVGRLAGGIAHDFNNLLTVINGYSGMLVDSMRNNPHASSQAAEILGAGTRAAELVAQLLAFSRRQMIRPKPFEINQLVQDVERMLRRVIGEHIALKTVLDPDTGWIRADLNQMEAVLLNLATNAQDAMPQGGILSIETSQVEVTANGFRPGPDLAPGSYVRLVVRDTGHGMDAETQRHLFEPFFTTKQRGKGTGLGLSSVYGSVEQNSGRIFVASDLGQGTAFSIYLPRVAPPISSESQPTMSQASYEGAETILLVEDEESVRRMMREALTRSGYRVWEAANGVDAIRAWGAQVNRIDLLVTDIVMPVMNGLRLAEELCDRRPALKVVFMSGHAEELISQQSGTDRAPDLLTKPFTPEVLVRKVREVLDHASNPVGMLRPCSAPHHSPRLSA